MFSELNYKYKYLLKLVISTAVVYLMFKYLLPLFFPVLIAYVFSKILMPIVNFCEIKFKFKRSIITAVLLITLIAILGGLVYVLISIVIDQIRSFTNNLYEYEKVIDSFLKKGCKAVGKFCNRPQEEIFKIVNESITNLVEGGKVVSINQIMGTSVDTIKAIIDVFVIMLTSFVTAYYLIMDHDKIVKKTKENVFYREISKITSNVCRVCSAYIRTQLIIMGINVIICFISFKLIGNRYAIIVSLLVGFLDALPLFGIGVILVPWTIILFILGSYFNAVVILITFIICYVLREVIEPKLMGDRIGISPLMTIISIYIGYKLFFIPGVVLGPIGYVIISSVLTKNEI